MLTHRPQFLELLFEAAHEASTTVRRDPVFGKVHLSGCTVRQMAESIQSGETRAGSAGFGNPGMSRQDLTARSQYKLRVPVASARLPCGPRSGPSGGGSLTWGAGMRGDLAAACAGAARVHAAARAGT